MEENNDLKKLVEEKLKELIERDEIPHNNVDALMRVYDSVTIAEDKNLQVGLRVHEFELEEYTKTQEIKRERYKLFIDAGKVLVPVVAYLYISKKGFQFEETGAFTSMTFKNVLQKIGRL